MKLIPRLAAACYILALPVFLITSNIRFLIDNVSYYEHGFREFGAEAATGIPLSQLDNAAQQIEDYFHNSASQLHIVVTVNGNEEPLFNQREIEHMQNVKSLVGTVFAANTVAMVVVLGYIALVILWARERSPRKLAVQSLLGVGLGFLVVAVVGGFAVAGFDQAWIRFHEIVFHNNLWEFNPATSHLIQMFPDPFWQQATLIIGGLTLGEAALIVVVAGGYLLFARKRRPLTSVRLGREVATSTEPGPARH